MKELLILSVGSKYESLNRTVWHIVQRYEFEGKPFFVGVRHSEVYNGQVMHQTFRANGSVAHTPTGFASERNLVKEVAEYRDFHYVTVVYQRRNGEIGTYSKNQRSPSYHRLMMYKEGDDFSGILSDSTVLEVKKSVTKVRV